MSKIKKTTLLLSLIAICFACEVAGIYKSIEDFKEGRWASKQPITFSFEIKDETVPYNIYYYVRNSLSYPYYNLYIAQDLKNVTGNALNLPKLKELTLFDPTSGKPYGDGLGDIFDHKILVLRDYKFPQKGKYSLKLAQDMRQESLVGILSVGIGIEDALVKK
jgi:gliding motility-associated lipoprotein GldH